MHICSLGGRAYFQSQVTRCSPVLGTEPLNFRGTFSPQWITKQRRFMTSLEPSLTSQEPTEHVANGEIKSGWRCAVILSLAGPVFNPVLQRASQPMFHAVFCCKK